ncbi:MAG: hypothetical protein ABJ360_24945 [Roseobacter sp.]
MKDEQKDRSLLAICTEDRGIGRQIAANESSDWHVVQCKTVEELLRRIKVEGLDAVVVPFDPFDHASRQDFISLAEHQEAGRPILVSYSTFNPNWIENLVSSIGSNLHIRGDLNIKEVTKKLEGCRPLRADCLS